MDLLKVNIKYLSPDSSWHLRSLDIIKCHALCMLHHACAEVLLLCTAPPGAKLWKEFRINTRDGLKRGGHSGAPSRVIWQGPSASAFVFLSVRPRQPSKSHDSCSWPYTRLVKIAFWKPTCSLKRAKHRKGLLERGAQRTGLLSLLANAGRNTAKIHWLQTFALYRNNWQTPCLYSRLQKGGILFSYH